MCQCRSFVLWETLTLEALEATQSISHFLVETAFCEPENGYRESNTPELGSYIFGKVNYWVQWGLKSKMHLAENNDPHPCAKLHELSLKSAMVPHWLLGMVKGGCSHGLSILIFGDQLSLWLLAFGHMTSLNWKESCKISHCSQLQLQFWTGNT